MGPFTEAVSMAQLSVGRIGPRVVETLSWGGQSYNEQNMSEIVVPAAKMRTSPVIGQTGIVIAILLLYSTGSRILALVGTVLACVVALTDPNMGLPLYIIAAFSNTFFAAADGVSASRLIGLTLILAYGIRLKRYVRKRSLLALLMIGLMLVWSMFSLIYSLDVSGSIDAISMLGLALAIAAMTVLGGHADDRDAMKPIACSMASMLIFVFLFLASEGKISVSSSGVQIGLERLTLSSEVNPGEFGRSVAQFSIFLVAYLLTGPTSRLEKLFFGMAYILGLILLIGSGSRSGTLSLMACTTLVVLAEARRVGLSKKTLRSILLGAASILIAVLVIFGQEAIADRFSIQYVLDTHGARRFILWELYVRKVIPQYFLLGTGVGGATEVAALGNVPSIYRMPSHNMILSLIVELGIVGLLIFGGSFVITALHGYRLSRTQPIALPAFAVFVLSLIMGVGEPMFFSKVFWVSFSLIWSF